LVESSGGQGLFKEGSRSIHHLKSIFIQRIKIVKQNGRQQNFAYICNRTRFEIRQKSLEISIKTGLELILAKTDCKNDFRTKNQQFNIADTRMNHFEFIFLKKTFYLKELWLRPGLKL
jgi:hypothetical protein